MGATRIEVNIPQEQKYDVRIGSGIVQFLGEKCRTVRAAEHATQIAVITDSNVSPLYLSAVKESLAKASYNVSDIVVPSGENTKSAAVLDEIWQALAELGYSRDCAIVALGGGVVGDLAGFAAATFMRGIPVIQVPTTLLAMVDSSVGGKTAINLPQGKNLVGVFWQPSFVCADTDTLSTLDEREWRCGCAEVAKSAVIDSDDFFFWLLDNSERLSARETTVVSEAISRCIVFKAGVVAEDKLESRGIRECLNYGHTLAHAIETLCGYGTYSHGAAVAEGMRFAAALSYKLLEAPKEFVDAQAELLDSLGLSRLPLNFDADAALSAMKRDKKSRGGRIRFVLVRDVGDWVVEDVDDATLLCELEAWIKSAPKG